MSFTSQVKDELARVIPEQACCGAAEAYGLLQCARSFTAADISIKTENDSIAVAYRIKVAAGAGLAPTAFERQTRPSGQHVIRAADAAVRQTLLERFGHTPGEPFLRLNRSNLECDECPAAYLRGAFLACGAVSDPQAAYHLEMALPYHHLSRDILTLMREIGLNARIVRRKGYYVIYLKDSEQIEDSLTLMGAVGASLDIMNVKIVKDVRNNANRVANCENANIDKTVAASLEQVAVIRRIAERGGLGSLPEELRQVAELRMENPELSLRELGEQLEPPLTRSGVNHRLKRILEWGKSL